MKSEYEKVIYTPKHFAIQFTMAKICNQHRSILYTMEYYLAVKKREGMKCCALQQNGCNRKLCLVSEIIMLMSETTNITCFFSDMQHLK